MPSPSDRPQRSGVTLRETHASIEELLGPAEEIEVAAWRLEGRLVGKLVFRTRGEQTGWFLRFGRQVERAPIEDPVLTALFEAPGQPALPAEVSDDPALLVAAVVADLAEWRSDRWSHWRDLELAMLLTRPAAAGWAVQRVRERLGQESAKRASA